MTGAIDRARTIGLVCLRWVWGADEDVSLGALVASTPVVWAVLLITVSVSTADYLWHGQVRTYLGVSTPSIARGQWWRLITAILTNGPIGGKVPISGPTHLLGNLVTLVLAGPRVERFLGRVRFVTLYVTASLAGCVALLVGFRYFSWYAEGSSMSTFGLQGAIVVLAFTRRNRSRAEWWYLVASWTAIALGWLSGLVQWGSATKILHLGGFTAGVALAAAWSIEGTKKRRLGFATVSALVVASLVLAGVVSARARRSDRSVTARVFFARRPALLTVAFGAIWVNGMGNGPLVRVDPRAQTVGAEIRSGRFGGGMVAAGGSLWASGGKSVIQIDPKSNRVLATVRVPGEGPWGITATPNAIWAALPDKGAVARIDLRSHDVRLTSVGRTPYAVSADRDAVFVTSYNSHRLSRLDPRTGRVIATTSVDEHPYWIEETGGSLWVGAVGVVYRINPRTLRPTAKIDIGQDFATLTADGRGCVWAAEGTSAEVSCIDTRLNRVTKRLRLGLREPVAIAPWGHDLWIADYGTGLIRITP